MQLRHALRSFLQGIRLLLLATLFAGLAALPAWATEFHGQVTFGGLPVPGAQASVIATQGDKTVTAVTDDQGLFVFPDLADGTWTLSVTMTGFAPIKQAITVAPNAPTPIFELKIETLEQIRAESKPIKVEPGTAPAVAAASADTAGSGANGSPTSATGGKKAQTQQAADNAPAPPPPAQDASAQPPDGFLINGSVNNAATSQFSLSQAFGNTRNSRSLYNASLALQYSSSTLNANSYSLLGASSKAPFNNYAAQVTFAGPLKIPHLLPVYRAPNFYISYGHSQTTSVNIPTALVPTTDEINGNLGALTALTGQIIYAPTSGLMPGCTATPGAPFPTNSQGQYIPASCISPVAQKLLAYYPSPNVTLASGLNYQIPLSTDSHSDLGRINLSKGFGSKNNVNGTYSLTSNGSSTPNLFGFVDQQSNLGQSLNASWYHRFTQRLSTSTSYSFSRQRNGLTTAFENKQNVSGMAGISGNAGIGGNLQDPANYGPPTLNFGTSGVSGLSDGVSQNNRNQTQGISVNANWNRFRHEVQFGGDFRRQEWNYFQQTNPRGAISFTGAATQTNSGGNATGGLDFADFLLGLPDTSQIAYGNPDKYLRESVYDFFVVDNFRVSPELTVNAGLRYEYSAPVTETQNRLVNLDFASGFTAETPVLASNPTGSLSHQSYPNSLLRPDRAGLAPSVGIAWRPISGSSLLVRSGYGLYHDTSVYQQTAYAMAQQAPLSTSLSLTSGPGCLLNLATPFPQCSSAATDTFAVDPNFRVGYIQAWNLSVDRDLPAALHLTVTYNGSKGLRGVQEILPNTYPVPGVTPVTLADPCPSCPKGFYYRMSNGNSTYEAGQVQVRRRLRAGLQASAIYTYSKSLDDDFSYGGSGPVFAGNSSAGSPQVAQDWRHPEAQRGLSTFDQRNKLSVQAQYTTGMGLGGHALMSGWRGAAYKEWTVLTNISVASGMPLTPIDPVAVPGSAYTGIIRADYVGGAVHQRTPGTLSFLNAGAFRTPAANQWGNAPRDFITGPSQFTMSASMQRTFRLHGRFSMDARIDANNVLNHVTFPSWNTTVSQIATGSGTSANSQFGTPNQANSMRQVTINLRLRY